MKQDFQTYSAVSWERVLNNKDDVTKLFKEMDIQCLEDIQIISRTYSQNNRLILNIAASNIDGEQFRIIIDATSGIPTWEQFINVTYDQGEDTNIKIILYEKDYEDKINDFTAGGLIEIGNLVTRNNKCRMTTYLVKGISYDSNGQKIIDNCSVEIGPDDTNVDPSQSLPSKRQVQEAEFWSGYYYPQWANDPIEIDDDIIDCWAPGYSLSNNLRTEASWSDDGFFIKIIGEQGYEALQWIWDNKKGEFENQYPDCPVTLETKDGKPYAISTRILDISMTDLINMTPKDKEYYGDYVFGQEHVFIDIANGVVDAYNAMNKAA